MIKKIESLIELVELERDNASTGCHENTSIDRVLSGLRSLLGDARQVSCLLNDGHAKGDEDTEAVVELCLSCGVNIAQCSSCSCCWSCCFKSWCNEQE